MMSHSRRTILRTLGCLAGVALTSAEPAESTLQNVITRHVAARGGAKAMNRIKRCRIKLDITEGGQTLQGDYRADIVGFVRIDIRVAGQLVYREGVDRIGPWLWPSSESAPKNSVATGAADALLNGLESNLVGLHRFAQRGHRLRLMPREAIDGVVYHVIEIVFKTGQTTYCYIDPRSWMIVRKRDERAYHPDADRTKKRIESRYSDFKPIDGVISANRNEDIDLGTGQLLSVNQVTERVWNPDIAEEVFDRSYTPT